MSAKGDFRGVLTRLNISPKYHGLLEELCGGEVEYLQDIAFEDLLDRKDAEGQVVSRPVARGILRRIQEDLRLTGPPKSVRLPGSLGSSLDVSALSINELRVLLQSRKDPKGQEYSTPFLRSQILNSPETLSKIAKALQGRLAEAIPGTMVLHALAVGSGSLELRQMAEASLFSSLLMALGRPPITLAPLLPHALAALAAVARHPQSHGFLVTERLVTMLSQLAQSKLAQDGNFRNDLLASLTLALLSQSGHSSMVSRIPLRSLPDLVSALNRRMFQTHPAQVVYSKVFFGLAMYFDRSLLLEAITYVLEHSGGHRAVAWQTSLPDLLMAILQDEVPKERGRKPGPKLQMQKAAQAKAEAQAQAAAVAYDNRDSSGGESEEGPERGREKKDVQLCCNFAVRCSESLLASSAATATSEDMLRQEEALREALALFRSAASFSSVGSSKL